MSEKHSNNKLSLTKEEDKTLAKIQDSQGINTCFVGLCCIHTHIHKFIYEGGLNSNLYPKLKLLNYISFLVCDRFRQPIFTSKFCRNATKKCGDLIWNMIIVSPRRINELWDAVQKVTEIAYPSPLSLFISHIDSLFT